MKIKEYSTLSVISNFEYSLFLNDKTIFTISRKKDLFILSVFDRTNNRRAKKYVMRDPNAVWLLCQLTTQNFGWSIDQGFFVKNDNRPKFLKL